MDTIAFGVGARKVCWPDGYQHNSTLTYPSFRQAEGNDRAVLCQWPFGDDAGGVIVP